MTPIEEGHEILAKLGISHHPKTDAERPGGDGSLRDQLSSRDDDRRTQWEESAPPSRLKYFFAVWVVAMGLGAFHIWSLRHQPPLYSADEESRNAQVAIFMAQAEVEAFRAAEGRLPDADDLEWQRRTVAYEGVPRGFRLTTNVESSGEVLVFTSGDDLTPFAEAYEAVLAEAAN